MSLLFYTAANQEYEFYTPLYIYSVLTSNPESYVEVGLEDAEKFKKDNPGLIRFLNKRFGERFKLSTVNFENDIPGSIRFITEPVLADTCDYVYIGDIDILVLDENIKEQHLENMEKNNAPFSNIIRSEKNTEGDYYRLSGLHFAPTDVQYPLPELDDVNYLKDIRGPDEHILYQIMEKKGHMVSPNMEFRPEHGIHMRKGDHPFGKTYSLRGPKFSFDQLTNGDQRTWWTGIEQSRYREAFNDLLKEEDFQELFFHLDTKMRGFLIMLENICNNRYGCFEKEVTRYVASYYINKTLIRDKFNQLSNIIKGA